MKIFKILDYILKIIWLFLVWLIDVIRLIGNSWQLLVAYMLLGWLILAFLGLYGSPVAGLIATFLIFYLACKHGKRSTKFHITLGQIWEAIKDGIYGCKVNLPSINIFNSSSSPQPTTTQNTQSTPQTQSVDDDRRPVSVVCSPSNPHFVNIYDGVGRLRNTVQVTQGNIIGQPIINGNVFTVTVDELGQKFVKTFSMENGSQKSIVKIQ